jgi:hypothetical protein
MSNAILGHKTLKFIKGYYFAPYDITPKINTLLENIISGTDEPLNQNILNKIQSSNQDFTDINNQLEEIIDGGVISFTIEGIQYYADDGMTWGEWTDSKYNTDGYKRSGLGDSPIITQNETGYIDDSFADTIIINEHNYSIQWT